MTPSLQQLTEPLLPQIEGLDARQVLDMLCNSGFIDRRRAEHLYARTEVDRLVAQGSGRCRAMHKVADTLCCSYEKVRNFLYTDF